jgi:transposase
VLEPVYNLWADDSHLVMNAEHIKALAGRKTDVQDAEWIAGPVAPWVAQRQLHPSEVLRELRDLTRYGTKLGDERKSEVNRVQKVLEDANIKLASVASDVMGVSARAMLAELVKGQRARLPWPGWPKVDCAKQDLLVKALSGRVRPHHRFMLAQHLSHIDYLDEAIGHLDQQIAEQMRPFAAALATWDSLPGINQRIAEIIVAEIGADLAPFEDADHWVPGPACAGQQRKCGQTQDW